MLFCFLFFCLSKDAEKEGSVNGVMNGFFFILEPNLIPLISHAFHRQLEVVVVQKK